MVAAWGVSGFRGPNLAVGMVRGARVFSVSPDAYLTGAVYKQKWHIGPNRAVCMRGLDPHLHPDVFESGQWPDPENPEHLFGECSCGFWSYYGRKSVEDLGHGTMINSEESILGVIEGYGRIIAGKEGFRATRAMLVAICMPDTDDGVIRTSSFASRVYGSVIPVSLEKLRSNYPDLPIFPNAEAMLAEYPPDGSAVGK